MIDSDEVWQLFQFCDQTQYLRALWYACEAQGYRKSLVNRAVQGKRRRAEELRRADVQHPKSSPNENVEGQTGQWV